MEDNYEVGVIFVVVINLMEQVVSGITSKACSRLCIFECL